MGDGDKFQKNLTMKKDLLTIISIILLGTLIYGLTLRGTLGNPSSSTIASDPTSAFESSHEKGPYGHVVSLSERGTYELTNEWADLSSPDVGTFNGHYYAFFAPGVSYLTMPFYAVGTYFGAAQLATYGAESFVSIITLVFIFLIGRNAFKLPRWAAFFAVIVYGFGSTSWSYAITLYQNAFTACFVVTAFYAAWRFSKTDSRYSWLYASYVWLAYALAIFVDYPNILLFLPIILYHIYSSLPYKKLHDGYSISIRWAGFLTVVVFVVVTGFQFWHNAHYYGGWSKLAGTLNSVVPGSIQNAHNSASLVATTSSSGTALASIASSTKTEVKKTAAGFFHEKNMPNGLYILLFSDQRGLLFFSPIF